MARKKKKNNADEGPSQGWMLTFCDLVTLLLTFFVMLNSMAVRDEKRVRAALGSLTDAFNKFKGGGFIDKKSKGGKALVGQTMENIRTQMEEIIRKVKISPKIKVKIVDRQVRMSVKNALLFERGSAKLTESGKVILAKVAEILKRYPFSLWIEGYAAPTEVNTRGDPIYLWELSLRRALNTLHCLESYGIDAKRLQPYGMGNDYSNSGSISSATSTQKRRVDLDLKIDNLKEFAKYLENKKPSSYYYKGFFFKLFEAKAAN